jgi:hypothetical protein
MGHGATIEDTRRWILAPGHVMMWGNGEMHVFVNDKSREKFLRRPGSVASSFRVRIHAYALWHADAWHAVPDMTNTVEEYWHNGQDM